MSDSRPAAANPGAIHTIHDAAGAAHDEGPLRFDDVDEAIAERVVDALRPYVSEARQQRIESALASRTQAVSVVLEDVHSEHNAAAVLRSADAMGLLEAHLIPRTTGFRVSRKVSIGAHKWLDVRAYPGPEQAYAALRARGVEVWASAIRGQNVPVAEIPIDRPTALVFGNEHEGLSSAAIDMADGRFHIPMTGFVESLNISVAAAITMYDVTRRRREAGQWIGLSEATTRRLRAAWYALSVRAASMILAQAGLPLPLMTPRPLSMQERRSEPCPDPEHPTMGSSASESMP
ncbi:MAG: RNA methyltransferase [Myxococcota bacterium]